MTLGQTLRGGANKLKQRQITNPHLEAEILLALLLKKPREYLLAHGEKKLTASQISSFRRQISRRLKGEPIAYLTGQKEFYGLNFSVDKNVLIPRPETELMVEEALKLVACDRQHATLVDVGTGSGCIIIALVKILKLKFPAAGCKFLASDISAKALAVARQNAKTHQVNKKIKFIKGDLLKPISNLIGQRLRRQPRGEASRKLIILANLPYGWPAWKNNTSANTIGLKFEPPIALFTDNNGLELYEKLFKQIKSLISELNFDCFALCEFDPRQTAKIKQLVKKQLPRAKWQIKKDLAGLNRLIIIKNNKV